MAKRFITSDIFEDAWFMDLQSKYKLFWIFLICNCDHAGIWQVNYKLAQFYVGEHLEPSECERIFKDRIVKISESTYWFIPKFIKFQYGNKLLENSAPLKSVINRLIDLNLMPYIENVEIITRVKEPLLKGCQTLKDKDKDKDKEKDKEKEKEAKKSKFDFSFLENSPFEKAFKDWLEYKGEKAYKNQKSLQIAFNHLVELSKNDYLIAQKIVNQSIANNWQGLFELKGNNFNSQVNSKYIDQTALSRYKEDPNDPTAKYRNINFKELGLENSNS